jgi:hypothetical protein
MKQTMPSPSLNLLQRFILLLTVSILFFACGPTGTSEPTPPCPPVSITKLYNLELSSTDYTALKTAFPAGNNMVVQFSYDKTKTTPLSLIAYASKPGHQVQPPFSKYLTAVSEATVALPDQFVLGDQQVPFAGIDLVIAAAGNPASYTLTFTPEMNGINVRFKVCVKGFACPAPAQYTQPSPPANAN